jgi:hypothetical protein
MDYNMPPVPGIDWEKAYQYLPDKEILQMVLQEVCATADEQTGLLLEFLEALRAAPTTETFRDYRVQVHSMKATLRSLGAELFSEALALEEAARDERPEPILQETEGFIDCYADLVRKIAPLTTETPGSDFHPETFAELVRNVRSAMEMFDVSAIQENLKHIRETDVPKEYQAGVDQLAAGCRDLDGEKVEAACKALLNEG